MLRRIIYLLIIVLCFTLCSCESKQTMDPQIAEDTSFHSCEVPDLIIMEDKSFFSDFIIENETVTLYCNVCIQNNTGEPKAVELHGDFTEDFESGLLHAALLRAYDPQSGDTTFLLSTGENHLRIAFSSLHAGETNSKQNRLLPKITITEVQNG